jgi:hypothetical protein
VIPVSYYVPHELTSPKFAYAFAKGCGGTISDDLDYLHDGPVALFGSPAVWPLLRQAQAAGREWIFADHGYFGRKGFFRITKNAYQHNGAGSASPDRFRSFGRQVQPWRTDGGHVLICPNSEIYFTLHGLDVTAWLATVVSTLRQYTDREIRIRWKVQAASTDISRDLKHAWAVVVFSSAAALDALIAGVPVFVLAPFAAAYRMGLDDLTRIETPRYPEGRESFLSVLASQQWTLNELFTGVAWRALQQEARCAA